MVWNVHSSESIIPLIVSNLWVLIVWLKSLSVNGFLCSDHILYGNQSTNSGDIITCKNTPVYLFKEKYNWRRMGSQLVYSVKLRSVPWLLLHWRFYFAVASGHVMDNAKWACSSLWVPLLETWVIQVLAIPYQWPPAWHRKYFISCHLTLDTSDTRGTNDEVILM